MMLRPHTPCTITPAGGYDIYGQESSGVPYESVCAVVKVQTRHDKTAVRADSSASRGYADEPTVDARLLFKPDTPIKRGDKVVFMGIAVQVIEVMPRTGLYGVLDHYQVDGVAWVS
jgi:hypothetical protein